MKGQTPCDGPIKQSPQATKASPLYPPVTKCREATKPIRPRAKKNTPFSPKAQTFFRYILHDRKKNLTFASKTRAHYSPRARKHSPHNKSTSWHLLIPLWHFSQQAHLRKRNPSTENSNSSNSPTPLRHSNPSSAQQQ